MMLIPTVSSLIYLATGKSFAIKDSKDKMSDAVVTAKKSTAKLMYDRSIEALAEENFVILLKLMIIEALLKLVKILISY